MSRESIFSTTLCEHIQRIEYVLDRRVACVVFVDEPGMLCFAVPGQLADRDLAQLLCAVGAASQDALKSL